MTAGKKNIFFLKITEEQYVKIYSSPDKTPSVASSAGRADQGGVGHVEGVDEEGRLYIHLLKDVQEDRSP